MSTLSTTKMTARQFLQLGEDPPGIRLELVNGEIEVSPSPVPKHSYTTGKLTQILGAYAEDHNLGRVYPDVDATLGEFDVRRPDLVFYSQNRLNLVGDKTMTGPPDLAIEVISPSSNNIDRKHKFSQYQSFGVLNYWIVDPSELTFEAFALVKNKFKLITSGSNSQTVSAPPFPKLKIALSRLWHQR